MVTGFAIPVITRERIIMPPPPPENPRRAPNEVVAACDTGQTAPDIVNAWEQWAAANGLPLTLTPALRGMTLRAIKGLLSQGYTAVQAKWALAYWIAEWASQGLSGRLSPTRLEEIALLIRAHEDPRASQALSALAAQARALRSGSGKTRAALAARLHQEAR